MAIGDRRGTRTETQFGICATPRPLRVAYLVADDANSGAILSKAFQESYGRWGGLHTLFVPVSDGMIAPEYHAWMRWQDPDFVYAFCDLSAETITAIDRHIGPSVFTMHKTLERFGPPNFLPQLETECLSSLSTLSHWGINQRFTDGRPRLVDAYPQWGGDLFVSDSFGLASRSTRQGGWPMPEAAGQFASCLALMPADTPANRWELSTHAELELDSEAQLLDWMAVHDDTVTMAQLAGFLALTGTSWRLHPWSDSLNLVVGDSFTDRISFWNGRLHHIDARTRYIKALRIPESWIGDPVFVAALGKFLARRNWITASGSSVQSAVTIRSSTVPVPALKQLKTDLEKLTHGLVRTEVIVSTLDCVPESSRLEPDLPRGLRRASQFESHREFAVTMPVPDHLSQANRATMLLSTGRWAVDLQVERHEPQSPYSNASHWWCLPRARSLLHKFTSGDFARIDRYGQICLTTDTGGGSQRLRLPEDLQATEALFSQVPTDRTADLRNATIASSKIVFVEPSDKGRHLTGAIKMFGSLAHAHQVLESRFWRTTLMEMAAPARNSDEGRLAEVTAKIKAGLGHKKGNHILKTASDWTELAKVLVKLAPSLRAPKPLIRYDKILDKWKEDLSAYLDDEPNLTSEREEIELRYEVELKESIQRRREEGVLAQGFRWVCEACAHDNWVSMSLMQPELGCVVCRTQIAVPADFRWNFIMNEFLAEALREHGLLALIWALGKLQHKARESFFFAPPLALYWKYPERNGDKPNEESDICCVRDGRFIIGEVKESGRNFSTAAVKRLGDLAERVRADIVVLACNEPGARSKLEKLAAAQRPQLELNGCAIEVLCPDDVNRGNWALP